MTPRWKTHSATNRRLIAFFLNNIIYSFSRTVEWLQATFSIVLNLSCEDTAIYFLFFRLRRGTSIPGINFRKLTNILNISSNVLDLASIHCEGPTPSVQK